MLDLDQRKSQIDKLPLEQKQQALKIIAAASLLIESEIADPNLAIRGIESDEEFEEGSYKITAKQTPYGNYLVVENVGESLMRLEMLGGVLIGVVGITDTDIAYWKQIYSFDGELENINDNIF